MRRRGSRAGRWIALLLLAGGLACRGGEDAPRAAPATVSRASWVMEPPELALGEVGEIELAVVTPPGRQPRPYRPPEAPSGLWVLDTESRPVQKEASRWIHRTRIRVRAREVGTFEWPGVTLAVDAPDGAVEQVAVAPLEIEVRSSLAEHAGRVVPYGVRALASRRGGDGSLAAAFAAGAGLVLACVGLVALARRRRAARAVAGADADGPEAAPPSPPWRAARDAVAGAGQDLERDPVAALDALSRAVRRYASARFRAHLEARTTEELEAQAPPFLLTTRWPDLLALLRDLDALRFPPASDPGALRTRGAELVRRAGEFVDRTAPREAP